MTIVQISIQKSTYDALHRLMRPALDDSVEDVIVSLLQNLERRIQKHQSPQRPAGDVADAPTQADVPPPAPEAEVVEDVAETAPAPDADTGHDDHGTGADVGPDVEAEPFASEGDGPFTPWPETADTVNPEHVEPTPEKSAPKPIMLVANAKEDEWDNQFLERMKSYFLNGANEVMLGDLLNPDRTLNRDLYRQGMKIIVSPDFAIPMVFTRTRPKKITVKYQTSVPPVEIIASEWKDAAIKVAEQATNAHCLGQVIVFEKEGESQDREELIKNAGRNVTMNNTSSHVYIADPEANSIDANGLIAPTLLLLIIAILQRDPRTRRSHITIEFEWKNSPHALFPTESGVLKVLGLNRNYEYELEQE